MVELHAVLNHRATFVASNTVPWGHLRSAYWTGDGGNSTANLVVVVKGRISARNQTPTAWSVQPVTLFTVVYYCIVQHTLSPVGLHEKS
jgi:hypothetical protein